MVTGMFMFANEFVQWLMQCAGRGVGSGEPERDAVHVVPNGGSSCLPRNEQVWRSPEKMP